MRVTVLLITLLALLAGLAACGASRGSGGVGQTPQASPQLPEAGGANPAPETYSPLVRQLDTETEDIAKLEYAPAVLRMRAGVHALRFAAAEVLSFRETVAELSRFESALACAPRHNQPAQSNGGELVQPCGAGLSGAAYTS